MKKTIQCFKDSLFSYRRISKLLLTSGLLIGLQANSLAVSGVISFGNEGFAAGAVINDNHIFNVAGMQFNVYAANFDGTPSANGNLYYDPGDGTGPWNKFPTEFGDGGFVTADVVSDVNQRWIDPKALVIKTADGKPFQLKSFKVHDGEWNAWGNYIKVSGYVNGALQGSQSFVINSANPPYHSIVTLTNAIFANVHEVRITFDKDNSPGYSGQPQYDGLFHSFDTFVVETAVSNSAPSASNVTFTGTLKTGQTLSGSYVYSDPDSDPESSSAFKWFRSDNGSGANKTVISNATSKTYTLVSADAGKYISFSVIPNDGTDAGTEVESGLQGPVIVPQPDIQIKGNNEIIVAGDNTPSDGDHTDFGAVATASGNVSRVFTIENTGEAALQLTDSDGQGFVKLSGPQVGDFSISVQPSGTIAAGRYTSFTVVFDPSGLGDRSAVVSIGSNDPNAENYTFAIKGSGLNTAPVITSNGGGANAFVNIPENTTVVTSVVATDADNNLITFAISGGADRTLFIIDAQTGLLNFNSPPDYENPADTDADGTYEVQITVSDGNGGSAVQIITVTVTDADDVTPVITANEGITLVKGGDFIISGADLQADDEDTDNDALVYVITNDPVNGRLELLTIPGISISSFTQAQLNADQVVYVHNNTNSDTDSFTFDVEDGAGNNLTGQVFNISISPITAINQPSGAGAIEIYPNPVANLLTLKSGNTGNQEVVIFNSHGTKVLHFAGVKDTARIDVSTLPAGVYHISLKSETGIRVSRFVKK